MFDFSTLQKITKQMSDKIASLRFICAVMVVVIYATPAPPIDTWQWWFVEMFCANGLCRVAIPYFFFISGFLIAGHLRECAWYRREVSKRVRTLLVPYVSWIIIGIAVKTAVWCALQLLQYQSGFRCPIYGPWWLCCLDTFGLNPFVNPGVLWFVRDLFVLVLLSCVLWWVLRHAWICAVVALASLVFVTSCYMPTLDVRWRNFFEYFLSARALFWFSIGILGRFAHFDKQVNSIALGAVSIVFWFVRALLVKFGLVQIAALCDVSGTFMTFAFLVSLPPIRFPFALTQNAFPIYLMHIHFLVLSIVLISAFGLRPYMRGSVALMFARVLFATMMSLSMAWFIRRRMPKVSSILFGGR